jgi:hypothetical protein
MFKQFMDNLLVGVKVKRVIFVFFDRPLH